jgi:hypothetical protein
MDEVDSVFNPKARERGTKDDLRALLNAGYRRGQSVYRMGGGNHTELQEFDVFGAKALAGLGSLPPTLASRCLRIEMKRRRQDEPVSDFFPQDVAEETAALREWLEKWTATTIDTLAALRPQRVDGLRDRTNEVWRPLLAIAAEAGQAWEARARRAALALAGAAYDDEASLGVLLLGDIRSVFEKRQAERIATADLLAELARFEESPWGEWWFDRGDAPTKSAPRRLAHMLHPYGIRSHVVRASERVAKGYKREDFEDAWERFLPARVQALQGLQGLHPASHGQTDVTDVTDVTLGREGADSSESATKSGGREDDLLREAAQLVEEGVLAPIGPDGWLCPCGSEKRSPNSTLTPVSTVVSRYEPSCPFCGRKRPETA